MLLPLGFVAGLAMSLYAFVPMVPVPASVSRYDDLPRRLIRLAHIAAIMLPLITIVVGPWLDRIALSACTRRTACALLLFGAAGLPVALAVEALVPPATAWHVAGPPATAFSLAIVLIAVGAARADLGKDISAGDRDRRVAVAHDTRRADA